MVSVDPCALTCGFSAGLEGLEAIGQNRAMQLDQVGGVHARSPRSQIFFCLVSAPSGSGRSDGKEFGFVPIRSSLSVGPHTVVLDCKPCELSQSITRSIVVKEDQTTRLVVRFD
jgi:hypothetical protein